MRFPLRIPSRPLGNFNMAAPVRCGAGTSELTESILGIHTSDFELQWKAVAIRYILDRVRWSDNYDSFESKTLGLAFGYILYTCFFMDYI